LKGKKPAEGRHMLGGQWTRYLRSLSGGGGRLGEVNGRKAKGSQAPKIRKSKGVEGKKSDLTRNCQVTREKVFKNVGGE